MYTTDEEIPAVLIQNDIPETCFTVFYHRFFYHLNEYMANKFPESEEEFSAYKKEAMNLAFEETKKALEND